MNSNVTLVIFLVIFVFGFVVSLILLNTSRNYEVIEHKEQKYSICHINEDGVWQEDCFIRG